MNDWQRENLRQIRRNLSWLQTKPNGVLMTDVSKEEALVVIKEDNEVRLFFAVQETGHDEVTLSGVMSRIDIENPLNLLGTYSQAMMLSLLLQPTPKKLYMMGFGGGRLPMVFHHHFPELHIDGSELDDRVLNINEMLFGLSPSDRIQVKATDGIDHLLGSHSQYDILLLDCFTGAGDHPDSISTGDFYQQCKSKLNQDGVVVQYLAGTDPMVKEKVDTFTSTFRQTLYYADKETHVLIGSSAPIPDIKTLSERAIALENQHQFNFPLKNHLDQCFILEQQNG